MWCQGSSGSFCGPRSVGYCATYSTTYYTPTYTCSSSGGSSSGGSSSGGSSSGGGSYIGSVATASQPPAIAAGGTFAIALVVTLIVVGVTTWQVTLAMAAGAAAGAAAASATPAVMMSNPLAKTGAGGTVVVATGGSGVVTMRSVGWAGFRGSTSTNVSVRRILFTAASALAFLNGIYFLVAAFGVWYSTDILGSAAYLSLHTAWSCLSVGGSTGACAQSKGAARCLPQLS